MVIISRGPVVASIRAMTPTIDETNFIATTLKNGASIDMGVNGSVTPVSFSYVPPAGKKFLCSRMIFYLEMATAFDSLKFGDLTALTNGISIKFNGTEIKNWKSNLDINLSSYDTIGYAAYAKTTRTISCRWTFTRATNGIPVTIRSASGIEAVVRDNLSAAGIIYSTEVQGYLVNDND